MSTRCIIHFTWEGQVEARVYRHCDGYPHGQHGVPADLTRFFRDIERHTTDHRFNSPTHLSGRFLVWQANRLARKWDAGTRRWRRNHRLDFLGVGVSDADPMDVAYVYRVECRHKAEDGRPVVSWAEAGSDKWTTEAPRRRPTKTAPSNPAAIVLPDLGD